MKNLNAVYTPAGCDEGVSHMGGSPGVRPLDSKGGKRGGEKGRREARVGDAITGKREARRGEEGREMPKGKGRQV